MKHRIILFFLPVLLACKPAAAGAGTSDEHTVLMCRNAQGGVVLHTSDIKGGNVWITEGRWHWETTDGTDFWISAPPFECVREEHEVTRGETCSCPATDLNELRSYTPLAEKPE